MSEPSVDLVGVRGNPDPFRSFSLGQSTQGRPTAIGGKGPSTPLSGMEALLTTQLAMQAQMVEELKTLATAAHANARNQGVGSAAGVTQSIGQQLFGGEALLSSASMDPLASATRNSMVAAAAQSIIPPSSTEQALSMQERGARRAAEAISPTPPDATTQSTTPTSTEQALSIQERGARLVAASLSAAPLAASDLSSKVDGRVGPRFEGDPWERTDENSALTIQQRAAESISQRLSSGGPMIRQLPVTSGFQYDDKKGWRTDAGEAASETAVMDQVASRTGGMRMDEQGRWYDTTDTGEAAYLANEEARSRLEAGTQNIDSDGNVVTGQALTRLRQGAAIRGGLQSAASTISQGGTVRGAATNAFNGMGVGNLAKGLGYAGAAVEIGTRVRDFANNQRAENASWQRVLGGSNAEGFGERFDQRVFSTAQEWVGGMDSGQADQLYAGAAAIHGTDTAGRSAAQDFGTKMWRELGIEVSDSLKLISAAASGGNDALLGVADALRNVTTSARDAGVSAEAARAAFTTQLASAAPALGGEVVTTQMSGLIASAQVQQGSRFENADFSPLQSERAISAIAVQQDMDFAEAQVAMQTDSEFAGRATTEYIRSQGGVLAYDPRIHDYVTNFVAENPEMTDDDFQDLADQVQNGDATGGQSIEPRAVQRALAQNLVNVTMDQAIEQMLRMLYVGEVQNEETGEMTAIGGWDLGAGASEMAEQTEVTQDDAVVEAFGDDADIVGTERGLVGAVTELGAEASGNTRVHSLLEGEQGETLRDVAEAIGVGRGADEIARAGGDERDYLRRFMQTGERQPVLERILREGSLVTDESRFEVQTGEGEDETRIVSFGELIRDYGDQGGTAEIIEGNEAGQTTAGALGLIASDEEVASMSADATSGVERGRPNILGMEEYESRDSMRGSITVVAEPLLRDALRFMGTGVVDPNTRNDGGPSPQPPVDRPRTG